ncbi:WD40 repeat domain-containing protein [Hydrogenimonas sp.]
MIRLFVVFALVLPLFAQVPRIGPIAKFTVRGFVNDFAVEEGRLFVATDRGSVDVFDLEAMRLLFRIPVGVGTTGRGERRYIPVLSVDVQRGRVLITGIVSEGFRAVWLYEKGRLKRLVGPEAKLTLKEARFDSEGHAVMASFASELIRYAPLERARTYRVQVSASAIGDVAMSSDREHLVIGDESGAVRVVKARSGEPVRLLPSKHLDQVHHVAVGGGVVVTGGNDRRVGVFTPRKSYHFRTDFPVYCVGVSPDGKWGVYLHGDDQILRVFDIASGRVVAELAGHEAVVNQIRFIGPNRLVSSEKGPVLLVWDLSRLREGQ